MQNKKTFCVLPYVAMNVHIDGGLSPCCYQNHNDVTHYFDQFAHWRSTGLESLKNNLNNGVRDERCQRCWNLEDNGVTSYRQQWNQTYADILDSLESGAVNDIRMLHLDFDNYCNLKCIMCHPQVSSSIEAEYKMHAKAYEPFIGIYHPKSRPWHDTEIFEFLLGNLQKIDTLILTGGEPLINPKVLHLLRNINLSQVNLIITTNATQFKQEVYDLIASAKTSSITVSLEGVGVHNEYLRYGSSWPTIENNIKRIVQLPNWRWVPININHTLQVTSAWSLPPLIKWCADNQYPFNINILTWPPYLGLSCMTDQMKQTLENHLLELLPRIKQVYGDGGPQETWITNAIVELQKSNHDPSMTEKFKSYIDMLDSIRGSKFDNIFNQSF